MGEAKMGKNEEKEERRDVGREARGGRMERGKVEKERDRKRMMPDREEGRRGEESEEERRGKVESSEDSEISRGTESEAEGEV